MVTTIRYLHLQEAMFFVVEHWRYKANII
jgi:hypothetical protein